MALPYGSMEHGDEVIMPELLFVFLSSLLPVFHVRNTLIFQVISPHWVAISSGPHPCYLFRSLG